MTRLSVNLNKVALLRNQRDMPYPSVTAAAEAVVAAGAGGITVHPRPDARHITRRDVEEIAGLFRSKFRGDVEFNIEGYPAADWLALVKAVRPHQATLVPDPPEAHTSEEGWDIPANAALLRRTIGELQAAGIRVSLFVEADPAAVAAAKAVGADRVELYTGPYGHAFGGAQGAAVLAEVTAAGAAARREGLGLNAGHDLNLDNLPDLAAALPWLDEVSIGHAFTADALRLGYAGAVAAYLAALAPARGQSHAVA